VWSLNYDLEDQLIDVTCSQLLDTRK
jgi:hypothetical protein